jgi:plastocyanin
MRGVRIFLWSKFSLPCIPMMQIQIRSRLKCVVSISLLTLLMLSCTKNDSSVAVGGALPSKFITYTGRQFTPSAVTVAAGTPISFLNSGTTPITVVSDDSLTIRTPIILPGTSFYYNKDTVGTFGFFIVEDSSRRGIISFVE